MGERHLKILRNTNISFPCWLPKVGNTFFKLWEIHLKTEILAGWLREVFNGHVFLNRREIHLKIVRNIYFSDCGKYIWKLKEILVGWLVEAACNGLRTRVTHFGLATLTSIHHHHRCLNNPMVMIILIMTMIMMIIQSPIFDNRVASQFWPQFIITIIPFIQLSSLLCLGHHHLLHHHLGIIFNTYHQIFLFFESCFWPSWYFLPG